MTSPTEVLAPGGAFIAKVLQGGARANCWTLLKRDFDPGASRQAAGQPQPIRRKSTSSPWASAGPPD